MQNKMYKRILALCICTIMIVGALMPATAGASIQARLAIPGNGTEANPYLITNIEQFKLMDGSSEEYYRLESDLDFAGVDYANEYMLGTTLAFKGKFDGNGYTIRNITITEERANLGLFAQTNGATIKNLRLENITIDNYRINSVGALVGRATNTTIENCTLDGAYLHALDYIGGLTGYSTGVNSKFLGNTVQNVTLEGRNYIGGLSSQQTITSTTAEHITGNTVKNISISGTGYLGGTFGHIVSSLISDSSVEDIVINGKGDNVGGLYGYSNITTTNDSYVDGYAITSTGNNVGGFAGYQKVGGYSKSYANIDVTGNENVGGLIGYSHHETYVQAAEFRTLDQVYFTGNVTGKNHTSGLIGYSKAYNINYYDIITNSFAIGTVSATDGTASGLVETSSASDYARIQKSYSAMVLSGNTKYGLSNYIGLTSNSFFNAEITSAANATYGKLTVGMRQEETFFNALWDFILIWEIENGITYPYLRGVKKPGDAYIIAPVDEVAAVIITPQTLELAPGQTGVVSATVLPADASNQTVVYRSSNTAVAVVDASTGIVTALSNGKATITAIAIGGASASCLVTVTDDPNPGAPNLQDIIFDPERATVSKGDTFTIQVQAVPNDAVLPGLNVISTDNSVLSVTQPDSQGNVTVTALDDGFAVIIAYNNAKNMAAFCHILVGNVSGVTPPSPGLNGWEALDTMSKARVGAAVAAIDGKIYVAGGRSGAADNTTLTSMEIYDTATGTWSNGPDMNVARYSINHGIAVNGKFYVIGGTGTAGEKSKIVEFYDPETKDWDFGKTMPENEKVNYTLAAVGNDIYVIGGNNTKVYIYNTVSNTWTTGANAPFAGALSGVSAVGDVLYIFNANRSFAFDTVANTWEEFDVMPVKSNSVATVASGDYIYVFGGRNNNVNTDAVQILHTPSKTWIAADNAYSLIAPRAIAGAALVGDTVYLVGGTDGDPSKALHAININLLTPAAAPARAAVMAVNLLESIAVSPAEAELAVDETLQLKVSFEPEDAEESVTFTSSDASVAAVDEDGYVTAIAPGTATITVKCGALKATCAIVVTSSDMEEAPELPEDTEETAEDDIETITEDETSEENADETISGDEEIL